MRRVLIINRGVNTDNFGDEAINFCLKKLLADQNCAVDSANYTVFFEKERGKWRSLIGNFKKVVSLVKRNRYDLVVFGGGQLIQSNQRFPLSFFIWIIILKLFSKSKIKTFGIGIDEKFSATKKMLFKFGFSYIDEFYVRDIKSQANLKNVFNKKACITPDVVFTMPDFYTPNMIEQQYILFGITTYRSIKRYKYVDGSEEDYLEEQAQLLLSFGNEYEIKIIYNTKEDYKYSIKLKGFIKSKYGIDVIIVQISNLFEYVDIVSSARNIMSSRMHALIIGLSYGVDIKPFIRNEKLKGFEQFIRDFNEKGYTASVKEGIKKLIA